MNSTLPPHGARSAAVALALLLLGGSPARAGDPRDPLPAVPPELRGARLLYQRPDGVYVRTLGQAGAVRVAAGGATPRWAPDGKSFAFLRDGQIVRFRFGEGTETVLARVSKGRALAFHPGGREVFFSDGDDIRAVDTVTGKVRTAVRGLSALELDLAPDGSFLAATVKAWGFRVIRQDLPTGPRVEIGRGCSAGVSADGRYITVNLAGHERLALMDSKTGERRRWIPSPAGQRLDNQKWSNRSGWIAAVLEGPRREILVQRAEDGATWRATDEGDCDRPDLWIP